MYDIAQWEKAVAFHGHSCGGLAIGFKAVQALRERLPAAFAADEEVVCITENDACGVDAIQALLGCTFGKGNLLYKPLGKMAFSFYLRESNTALRLYFKGLRVPVPRGESMELILNAPCEELFSFGEPPYALPVQARRFRSETCAKCGEQAREDKIRLDDGAFVCLGCFAEYDR